MMRCVQIQLVAALAAYLFGLGFGMATIVSLVPALVNIMRMLA